MNYTLVMITRFNCGYCNKMKIDGIYDKVVEFFEEQNVNVVKVHQKHGERLSRSIPRAIQKLVLKAVPAFLLINNKYYNMSLTEEMIESKGNIIYGYRPLSEFIRWFSTIVDTTPTIPSSRRRRGRKSRRIRRSKQEDSICGRKTYIRYGKHRR